MKPHHSADDLVVLALGAWAELSLLSLWSVTNQHLPLHPGELQLTIYKRPVAGPLENRRREAIGSMSECPV
jgi:hypothetical protein